jgi:hypothetical protein
MSPKTLTLEMRHVEGDKAPYLSLTGGQGGTINAQGQSSGTSLYLIDLAYVSPSEIAMMYTDPGLNYFMLAKGRDAKLRGSLIDRAKLFQKKKTELDALREVKTSTPEWGGKEAAQEDPRLTNKDWVALMDVIRTKEILVTSKIPAAALSKK